MHLSVLHVIFLYFIASSSGRLSGIYTDNGVDQTIINELLSRQDRREIQKDILSLLGLHSRPKSILPVHFNKSAPKFLLDVYQGLRDDDGHSDGITTSFSLSGDDRIAIDESDTIMSFMSQKKHIDGMRHDGSRRLWFNVSSVLVEDMIVGAELRIYQSQNRSKHRHQWDHFTVTAYQTSVDDLGRTSLEYVDSINTTCHKEGWLVLNMTRPFSEWVAIPSLNLGIYLSLSPRGNPSHELRLEEIGIVPAHGRGGDEPFLVAFMKSSGVREEKVRQVREAKKRKRKSQNNSHYRAFGPNALGSSYTKSCHMRELYVGFKDLNWQDWIVAPEGFHAFVCVGVCNFPLNAHMNATNHAIVQTLAHVMNDDVPKPCCAPTKLSSISVLYFVESSSVMLKKYMNMVVKSCGCH